MRSHASVGQTPPPPSRAPSAAASTAMTLPVATRAMLGLTETSTLPFARRKERSPVTARFTKGPRSCSSVERGSSPNLGVRSLGSDATSGSAGEAAEYMCQAEADEGPRKETLDEPGS